MHISNAISSSSNAKNGISRWCWLKVFGTQFEEWIYAISNAGNEARMSFSHLLKQSREFHRMNKMYFKIDKMCMSNSEMLSPHLRSLFLSSLLPSNLFCTYRNICSLGAQNRKMDLEFQKLLQQIA